MLGTPLTTTPYQNDRPNFVLMKPLRLLLPFLLLFASLRATAPRFYVTGQVGQFTADAGTVEGAGYFVLPSTGERKIKSGTKTFRDFSLGAEFNRWFSLEAGYAHFNAFRSPWMSGLAPGVQTVVAVPDVQLIYRLQVVRLTPVLSISLTERFSFKLFGGLTHSNNQVTTATLLQASSPRYSETGTTDNGELSYQLGVGMACRLTKQATVEARILRYDFGKPENYPNRITALTYSLGLSWRF